MKILHTADWHIGSFKGPEKEGVNLRSEDTMKCLRSLVETAEKEKPDLVLVSGDIFHQAEIWQGRSHKEVLQAREIILALSRAAGQVIVMRGTPNHDSEEAFLELKAHFEFIDNVKIVITPELVRTSYADIVAVPGFDKGTFRAQHPGISKEDENIVFSEELGKIVVGMRAMCSGDVPAILMSHYTVPGCNTESGQTQFLTQFEPVITQDMLLAADYDLVALGHIHRPQMINGLRNVYYSGAVNAMNFNDEGQDRGFWLYEMKRFSNEKWDISDAWFRKTPYREFIVDCLYEEPREGTNTGWIRNDEKARSGSISFTFGLGDKMFRVVRTRTKSGKPTLNLSELLENEWVDRSKEKIADTQKEIIRLLGMDSLTFKACVLIMQDQYGLFLEAGKEERVGVLSNLLGLGIYGIMEDLAKDELGNLKRDIAKKRQTINIHSDKGSVPRKRGAPKGNKNAVGGRGNPNAKPPDATKHGGYSAVYWDTLDEDEKNLIEDMPKDEEELLIEQIQLFSVRERRIMKAINKYRNSESPVALAFSQRSERKRTFENDEDKEEYARRIAEKVAAGERLPGNEYSVFTQTDNKDQIIARLESELSNVQSKKTKAIEALSKMHIEHQKIDGGNKGNDVVRMWAEKVLQNRRDSDG